jgi:hypothetical protein
MTEIILKTNAPDKAAHILKEALATEASRIKYSLNLAKKRLERFESKYNISSAKFINEAKFINDWSSEDLKGEDMEYVEWSGEYQLYSRLNERLEILESIENVAS